MNPPNLWEEVARYGEGGLAVYCLKLFDYRGTGHLVGQAFATPLDTTILTSLIAERPVFARAGCRDAVSTIDSTIAMMRAEMARAAPRRPLGKRLTSAAPSMPPTASSTLAMAQSAAARGQTTIARVLYNQYLARLASESPGASARPRL